MASETENVLRQQLAGYSEQYDLKCKELEEVKKENLKLLRLIAKMTGERYER